MEDIIVEYYWGELMMAFQQFPHETALELATLWVREEGPFSDPLTFPEFYSIEKEQLEAVYDSKLENAVLFRLS